MPVNWKQSLKDDLKMTDDQIALVEGKLNGVLAEQEAVVSAKQREIESAQQALQDANGKLNSEIAEWANLTAREQQSNTAMQDRLDQAQRRVLELEQHVQRIATQAGVDPTPILKTEPLVPPTPTPAPIDTSKFVSTDQFGPLMNYMLTLPADLMSVAAEHKKLFNEDLDPRAIIAEVQRRAAKKEDVTVARVWEDKYGVPARREAAAKEKYDADMQAAEARGMERARTEQALPNPSVPGRRAIVFGAKDPATGQFVSRTSALKRPQPETGVRAAAAAFASGKYRTTA